MPTRCVLTPVELASLAHTDAPAYLALLVTLSMCPTTLIYAPPGDHMRILVAEDDLLNSKIIKKRLEMFGHEVYLTVNGEECSGAYREKTKFFDIVLMDIQVCTSKLITLQHRL
jgi:hypothetical protein